jgi:DNA-binding NarL/FixJ family response regulator
MLNIIIIDDSYIFKERLVNLLKSFDQIKIVGEFDTAKDVLTNINKLNPDVILLDIKLKSENGIDLLKKLKSTNLKSKILMVTNYPYPQYKMECLKLGADYFFDKSTELDNLIRTIIGLNANL